jgi:hypothetical protein
MFYDELQPLIHEHMIEVVCRCRIPYLTPIHLRYAADTYRESIDDLNIKTKYSYLVARRRHLADSYPTRPSPISHPSLDNPTCPGDISSILTLFKLEPCPPWITLHALAIFPQSSQIEHLNSYYYLLFKLEPWLVITLVELLYGVLP